MNTAQADHDAAGNRRWLSQVVTFLVAEADATRMRAFECAFTTAFLINLGHAFLYWREWLTDAGIHLNAQEMAAMRYPAPWPLLAPWQAAIFAALATVASLIILLPRRGDGKIKDWLRSAAGQKTGYALLLVCALYAQRVDYVSATMVNRLFVSVFAILLFAPPIRYAEASRHAVQSVAPLRLLQATLTLVYFASGLSKMQGAWLISSDVLWSHVQGLHRTDIAAWALRHLPRWCWSIQQHVALLFEVGAPLFFTLRFFRPFACTFGVIFHLMIALLMQDLILYSVVMWSFYLLFIPDRLLQKLIPRRMQGVAPITGEFEAAQASSLAGIWVEKLGGWQTDLLTRGFGFLRYLNLNCFLLKRSLPEFLAKFPASTLYLGLCGLALTFLGARLPLLLLSLLCAGDYFIKILYGEAGEGLRQQAAEYPFFIVIPAALLLLVILQTRNRSWERSAFHEQFEKGSVLIFRWSCLTTLFFVCFHKLNTEFFDPAYSCEIAVKNFYAKSWTFRWLQTVSGWSFPALVILIEGVLPILLLLSFRRVGIIFIAVVYGMIAFVDALTITLCVILPSLAFLEKEDWQWIRKRQAMLVKIWLLILAVWLPFSCGAYIGIRPWFQPALYQSVVLAVIVAAASVQVSRVFWPDSEGNGQNWQGRLGFQRATVFPQIGPGSAAVWMMLIFWVLNGFSPYLGWKFNYSFAMLSNLRVDDARWNHLLVPKWVRLTEHDGFFHIQKADLKFSSKNDEKSRGQVRLKPGLFSPQAFHDELRRLSKLSGGVEVALLLEHEGRAYDYQGSLKDLSFQLFLDRLPQPQGHWLHDYLPSDGPMGCKH